MAIPLVVNGQTFEYPVNFDESWGIDATGWAQAVTNGMLQRQGGNFPLTADVNFGASFGLKAAYFETRLTNPATSGLIRLSKTDTIEWRNNANTADNILAVDGSDNLTFNGSTFGTGGNVNTGTANQLAYYPLSTNSVSGLASITANSALVSNSSGLPIASSVSATTLAFLDATSSVQTQINATVAVANAALPKTGGTMSGPIAMGSNKITGLANGSSPQDAVAFSQIPTNLPPTGSITMYGGASAPSGWLLCDGTSYITGAQAALFAIIGYTFGGSGVNFNVPNMTNNVPVGAGSLAALGATTGSQTVTPTSIAHTHTISHQHIVPIGYNPGDGDIYAQNPATYGTSTIASTTWARQAMSGGGGSTNIPFALTSDTQTANSGSTTVTMNASSVVQPSLGITFIIKA